MHFNPKKPLVKQPIPTSSRSSSQCEPLGSSSDATGKDSLMISTDSTDHPYSRSVPAPEYKTLSSFSATARRFMF